MTVTLGLDLSLTSSGMVVMKNRNLLDYRNPKTKPPRELEDRIDEICFAAVRMFKKHKPDLVVMEGGARGGKFVDLGIYHLAGHVRVELWKREAPMVFVPPTQLKKWATGAGNASKGQMLDAARDEWPECPNHDLADGWHLAQYGILNIDRLVSLA